MKNFYVRLIIVILIVVAIAEFAPGAVNWLLLVVLAGMVIMNADQFAKLVASLKL
jgi:ABC-type polysaccharide/polyol phosphate export permease